MEVIEIKDGNMVFLLDKGDAQKYHLKSHHSSMKEGYSRLIEDSGLDRSFLSGVLVQIFDSKNGGCEMFVSKIQDGSDSARNADIERNGYIYTFKSLEHMLSAISFLSSQDIREASAYYNAEFSSYFLCLSSDCRYLSEFMAAKAKNLYSEYLSEHCTLICYNAIENLSQYV
ncbi:MAG: hypothetical protein IJA52_05410 [Clostridia bacterium]|nr:hypothetical protein [Clostridia bacterium]